MCVLNPTQDHLVSLLPVARGANMARTATAVEFAFVQVWWIWSIFNGQTFFLYLAILFGLINQKQLLNISSSKKTNDLQTNTVNGRGSGA